MAVAAVVIILLATRDSEPEVTAPPPQEQTAADPALDQLGAFLPPEVVNCEEGATVEFEGWTAAATCDPASGDPVVIQFFLYESPEAARTAYDGRLASAGLPSDVGDCSIGEAGEMGWSGDGGQGRLLCGTNDAGHVALEWTSDAFPIVGSMFATTTELTVQDIYTLWQGISDYTSV